MRQPRAAAALGELDSEARDLQRIGVLLQVPLHDRVGQGGVEQRRGEGRVAVAEAVDADAADHVVLDAAVGELDQAPAADPAAEVGVVEGAAADLGEFAEGLLVRLLPLGVRGAHAGEAALLVGQREQHQPPRLGDPRVVHQGFGRELFHRRPHVAGGSARGAFVGPAVPAVSLRWHRHSCLWWRQTFLSVLLSSILGRHSRPYAAPPASSATARPASPARPGCRSAGIRAGCAARRRGAERVHRRQPRGGQPVAVANPAAGTPVDRQPNSLPHSRTVSSSRKVRWSNGLGGAVKPPSRLREYPSRRFTCSTTASTAPRSRAAARPSAPVH